MVHNGAILEAARLTLVRIADDCLWIARCVGDGFPLDAGGESRTAATGEFAGGDEFDQLLWRAVPNGVLQRVVAGGLLVSVDGRAPLGAVVAEHALLDATGIRWWHWGGALDERVFAESDEHRVALDNRDHVVASAAARHRCGTLVFERLQKIACAVQATNVAGAHPRRGFAGFLTREVVVERDGAIEFRDGDLQRLRDRPDRTL